MANDLGEVSTELDSFAKVISDMVDADVIITDSKMLIVGSAFGHFSLYNDIKIGSLISAVLMNNKDVIIQDKKDVESCRECDAFKKCKMKGFIGVPVVYEKQNIGVIALILAKSTVNRIFEKLDSNLTFMHNMAELVAARMTALDETERLHQKIDEIENLVRTTAEAIAYTDYYGNIIFTNDTFDKYFAVNQDVRGRNITSMLDFDYLREYYLSEREEVKNYKASFYRANKMFYGVMSTKRIYVSKTDFGIMLSFRKFSDIHKDNVLFMTGTYVTFDWLSHICGKKLTDEAEQYAVTDRHLLINTEDDTINELIAKAIYNFSDRRLQDLKITYMNNVYKELIYEFLFDEYGVFRNMDRGTVIMHDPQQIPLMYQEELADFLKSGVLNTGEGTVKSSVRLLICTSADLKKLTKEGVFSQRLYDVLAEKTLRSDDTIHNNRILFESYVQYLNKSYSEAYKKPCMDISAEEMEAILKEAQDKSINEIGLIVERRIKTGTYTYESPKKKPQDPKPIREIEREEITNLVKKGYGKLEICEMLGMSRTTLYRRMKQYGLLDEY